MTSKKDPLEATSNPSTWTRTQKVGLIFFSGVVIIPMLFMLAEDGVAKLASDFQRQLASNSAGIALLISFYLFASNTPGDLLKSVKILFTDFRFDLYVVREIASWVYFVGMVAFFTYFIEGLVLLQWSTIGISIALFVVFRILLELAITAVATAENTSFISKQ